MFKTQFVKGLWKNFSVGDWWDSDGQCEKPKQYTRLKNVRVVTATINTSLKLDRRGSKIVDPKSF
jgi:hypothetical protein